MGSEESGGQLVHCDIFRHDAGVGIEGFWFRVYWSFFFFGWGLACEFYISVGGVVMFFRGLALLYHIILGSLAAPFSPDLEHVAYGPLRFSL